MSLYLVSFSSGLGRWVVPRKNFGLNLCQAKSGVISFWVGGWFREKNLGLNLYQAKFGVISFWMGGSYLDKA